MASTQEALSASIELPDISPHGSPNVGPKQAPRKKVRMMATVGRDESATRAPPLQINDDEEVIVVNGDRSNLTWKRYKLISITERTGMCVVEGISDSRQRNFPRSVVKPKACGCARTLCAYSHPISHVHMAS